MKFIKIIDKLFDILNSRSVCGRGYKSPLRMNNTTYWKPFFDETTLYIMGLKNADGRLMVTTKKKTAFVGFLTAISAIKGIFEDLIERKSSLKYLLTYKLSQDHIELFFEAIRASGGCNNNPTVQQITAAYKRMLLKSSITSGGNGNCKKVNKHFFYFLRVH